LFSSSITNFLLAIVDFKIFGGGEGEASHARGAEFKLKFEWMMMSVTSPSHHHDVHHGWPSMSMDA
jgi:hypothetical protein